MRLGRLPRLTCRYRKVNAAAGAMGTNAVTFVQARRGFTAAWAVSLAAALGACESRRNEISHPTPENLPPRGNPLIVSDSLPTGLSAESLSDWTEARNKFLRARTVLRLGKLGDEEGGDEDPEVFGLIWDVELDDAGNIHVLDMDNYQVRVFDPAGRYVNGFGGPGDGPEEFYEPNGLALLSDGSLVVSDRGNRLKVFAKTESGYRRSRTIQIPLVPTSLCSVEDRIFVAGWKREDDTIVHEIAMTPEGANRDIGRGYDAGSSLVRGQLSDGLIACLGYPPRVVFAFSLFPVARAYRADRPELLWTTRVQDYAQTKITERRYSAERSAVAFSHEGVMENLILTHSVSPKHVLLQTGRGERAGPDEASRDPSIRTYLVDAATGRGALVSDSLPLIMAADSNRHVAVWLTPFPRLEVRTATGSP